MKLTPPRSAHAARQLEAWVVPDAHPANQSLSETFGEHTFFLDGEGLSVIEPRGVTADGATELARVVRLASWADEERTALAPHTPQETEFLVVVDEAA
ncbi:MAG: hypothetical protein E7774_06585 [Bradyrhizobium sp.]|nr:MAG: hypothetical protein E7774_06585 [Bradyrhizobium sp.]